MCRFGPTCGQRGKSTRDWIGSSWSRRFDHPRVIGPNTGRPCSGKCSSQWADCRGRRAFTLSRISMSGLGVPARNRRLVGGLPILVRCSPRPGFGVRRRRCCFSRGRPGKLNCSVLRKPSIEVLKGSLVFRARHGLSQTASNSWALAAASPSFGIFSGDGRPEDSGLFHGNIRAPLHRESPRKGYPWLFTYRRRARAWARLVSRSCNSGGSCSN